MVEPELIIDFDEIEIGEVGCLRGLQGPGVGCAVGIEGDYVPVRAGKEDVGAAEDYEVGVREG